MIEENDIVVAEGGPSQARDGACSRGVLRCLRHEQRPDRRLTTYLAEVSSRVGSAAGSP